MHRVFIAHLAKVTAEEQAHRDRRPALHIEVDIPRERPEPSAPAPVTTEVDFTIDPNIPF